MTTWTLWQGFDLAWEAVPHRLGLLACGIVDLEAELPTRIYGTFPGINGDTLWVDQGLVQVDELGAGFGALHGHTDVPFWTRSEPGRAAYLAQGGHTVSDPVVLPQGVTAVAILQSVTWRSGAQPPTGTEVSAGTAGKMWPTTVEVEVLLDRTSGGDQVVAKASVMHEDAPDIFKPSPSGDLAQHLRLGWSVLYGPPELFGAHRLTLYDDRGASRRFDARLLEQEASLGRPLAGPSLAALTGFRLKLWHARNRFPGDEHATRKNGRYLSRLAVDLLTHASSDGVGWSAYTSAGWRGEAKQARCAAEVSGVALHLGDAGVRVTRKDHKDAVRFALPDASLGSIPSGPHDKVRNRTDPCLFGKRWG